MRPHLSPPRSPGPTALRPSVKEQGRDTGAHTHTSMCPFLVEPIFPLGTVQEEWRELLSSSARLWGPPAPCPGSRLLCLQIDQPTLGMPSRDYYFNEGSNQKVSRAGPRRPGHFFACPSALPAPPIASEPTCGPASLCDLDLAAHS